MCWGALRASALAFLVSEPKPAAIKFYTKAACNADNFNKRFAEFLPMVTNFPDTANTAFLFADCMVGVLRASQLKKDADVWTITRAIQLLDSSYQLERNYPKTSQRDFEAHLRTLFHSQITSQEQHGVDSMTPVSTNVAPTLGHGPEKQLEH
ncbi:hypothetical protein OUZ56_016224 [Daphnia magna]|uniref:Uncharacterized protein n=1 Tax=Daphnia magna TaxID=35525 RepID=A0ABR0AQ14_9CRUS|nr:hypothetical protein OUZ56_016224 [Daphnia magna]